MEDFKKKAGAKQDTDLTAEQLKSLVEAFKKVVKKETKQEFPQNPLEQMKLATEAVFGSWNGKRAIDYRRATNIPDDLGTAVNIVTMVFGNMGWDSGTGVAFTRNPSTGENILYGDYLLNAQGEDVVAGIRNTDKVQTMGETLPKAYKDFIKVTKILEKHYHDMQDMEFTVERGRLWMLQTRNGKRTALAAVRMAVEMANEKLITKQEAILRVTPDQVDTLLHPQFDPETKKASKKEGKYLWFRRECFPGCSCRARLLRCRYCRKEEQGRKAGRHHGAPVHQAG